MPLVRLVISDKGGQKNLYTRERKVPIYLRVYDFSRVSGDGAQG